MSTTETTRTAASTEVKKKRKPFLGHEVNDKEVYFYGGPFSNYATSPIVINGKKYKTVEHWFAANKFRDEKKHESIRNAKDPNTAKALGRKYTGMRKDWNKVKYKIMLIGLRAKYSQNPKLRKALKMTGERMIYEDSPYDPVWGILNGGTNLLGKALMQVRKEIKAGKLPPSKELKAKVP